MRLALDQPIVWLGESDHVAGDKAILGPISEFVAPAFPAAMHPCMGRRSKRGDHQIVGPMAEALAGLQSGDEPTKFGSKMTRFMIHS